MEEEDEEAGPERQQVGRRGSSLAGEQRPWRKGMRKQGRRGSGRAGEQRPQRYGLRRQGRRGSKWAGEAAA